MISDRFLNRVLILNADYQPLSILPLSTVHWQEAIKLVVTNDAYILEKIDDVYIRSEKLRIEFPSVILLRKYVKEKHKILKLTKSNIFIRDFYTCCFCNKFLFYEKEKITIDHIIPKSKGGKSTWQNLVSSCERCNNLKGNKIIYPEIKPAKPSYMELVNKRKQLPIFIDHHTWKKYFYDWDENNILIKNNVEY